MFIRKGTFDGQGRFVCVVHIDVGDVLDVGVEGLHFVLVYLLGLLGKQ